MMNIGNETTTTQIILDINCCATLLTLVLQSVRVSLEVTLEPILLSVFWSWSRIESWVVFEYFFSCCCCISSCYTSIPQVDLRLRVSHFTAVSQSVSQYVLASSPLCGRLTRYCFLYKCLGLEFVLSLWAPSLMRGRVCPLLQSSHLSVCTFTIYIFVFHTFTPPHPHTHTHTHYTIYIVHTRPLLVPARYSRLCPTTHP
jgi:hypothetical protein